MESSTKKETPKTKKLKKALSLYPLSLEEALKIALTTSLPEKDKKLRRKSKKEKGSFS
jgi:hypothetical protein